MSEVLTDWPLYYIKLITWGLVGVELLTSHTCKEAFRAEPVLKLININRC
jgi:hypothetical protein